MRFEEVTCLEDICFLPSLSFSLSVAPQQPDGRNLSEQPATIHNPLTLLFTPQRALLFGDGKEPVPLFAIILSHTPERQDYIPFTGRHCNCAFCQAGVPFPKNLPFPYYFKP